MITIGTDCSGIEAPIEALKQLGIPFVHKWACEKDKFARMSIMANCEPEVMYTDITQRDHTQLPDVDLYVCGFPCQSFSLMGKKLGTKDPRANIMLDCINVIKTKQPKVFILENVKNFKFIEGGKPFRYLIDTLGSITDDLGAAYSIFYDIFNTRHYGIPQNRERIYIIGIKHEIQVEPFAKPVPTELKQLDDFILDKNINVENLVNKNITRNLEALRAKSSELSIVTGDKYYFPIVGCCPTLTSHCADFYVTRYNRKLRPVECLFFQGFNEHFQQVVSNTQMYKQAGNSMSVNVLKAILNTILSCTLLGEII